MLSLHDIRKVYGSAGETVEALKGLTLHFRPHEFVSILGQSGCGKTTLLNIIGGLDRYTEGDLVIEGISTKLYTDRDWDSYRNHRVGFVFQNYQLIPHQTVLANVELALTLSGVPKAERRRRATEALVRVGLGDQLKKRPNQMSGGQMQRVAIARALVNDPEILLADEPTGALDTQTSEQIMDLLSEVAKDRLVIMVTHNPDLAMQYSSRIVRMLDGRLLSDSHPYDGVSEEVVKPQEAPAAAEEATVKKAKKRKKTGKEKKTSMSFWTALALSCNNLLTKKTRTALTSFAGSIGIVGIALILALSNGIQLYIDRVEADALSSTPITIEATTMDMNQLLTLMAGAADSDKGEREEGKVYSSSTLIQLFQAFTGSIKQNDLKAFKEYMESDATSIADPDVSTIEYIYGVSPQIWATYKDGAGKDKWLQVNESEVLGNLFASGGFGFELFDQLLDNPTLLENQYGLLSGAWPTEKNQVVLVVDKNHEIGDLFLYALGLKNPDELSSILGKILNKEEVVLEDTSYTYDDLLNLKFHLAVGGDLFVEEGGVYEYRGENQTYLSDLFGGRAGAASTRTLQLEVSGIICPHKDATATSVSGVIGYTSSLTDYILEKATETAVYTAQKNNPNTDITVGLPFAKDDEGKIADIKAVYDSTGKEIAELRTLFIDMSSLQKPSLGMFWALGKHTAAAMAYLQPKDKAEVVSIATRLIGENKDAVGALMGDFDISSADDEALASYLGQKNEAELRATAASLTAYFGDGAAFASFESAAMTYFMPILMDDQAFSAAYAEAQTILTEANWLILWEAEFGDTVSRSTYDQNMTLFGMADKEVPRAIHIYPINFDQKDYIIDEINRYNQGKSADEMISYTDIVGALFSSISVILNVITYVLVAFVSISLVVSSIMIGIITYISVLERTREIGILRSVGASKGDIARVFNAETLIVGFVAGMIGILGTLILMLPINLIIRALSGISTIGAALRFTDALVLVIISMALTLISGLIPSFKAAKKDPVEALRSE